MKKIVTFGELLLRFSKNDHLRLTQGDMFTSKYGGSEANVAVSLATQGENVTYITRLPDTPVGHAGAMNLAQLGVDTSHVLYGGQRIGTYYFEPAAGMRAPKVIYDRANSALLDGAVGTTLWGIAEAHGVAKVPVWRYNIEHPEFVEEVVRGYVDTCAADGHVRLIIIGRVCSKAG